MPSAKNILTLDSFNLWLGLTLVALLAGIGWLYLFYMAWAMDNMDTVSMWMPPLADTRPWYFYDFLMLFMMWAIMMLAMMLPTAIPVILVFMRLQKTRLQKQSHDQPLILASGIFILGYLAAWTCYSLAVSVVQWQLHKTGLLNPMMTSGNYLMSGLVLLLAGIYQWTPFKNSCLKYCRSPLAFLLAEWREGSWGSLRLGFRHGSYCVGCCAFLMAVLFAVGVMNMLWVLALTVFVALEKTLMPAKISSVLFGGLLFAWGLWWISLHWLA